MKRYFVLIAFLAVISIVVAKTKWHELEDYNFEKYVKEFSKSYGGLEYEHREKLFNKKLASIREHNRDHTKTWKRGVNHMTDWTEEELKSIRGIKKDQLYSSKATQKQINPFVNLKRERLPRTVDWRQQGVVTPIKDQGECGSCWTFASAETLESHWALATGQLMSLSEQQILDCTPNPNQCGGTGGCQGGTTELAYSRIMQLGGLATEWTYPYVSWSGQNFQCQLNVTDAAPFAQISNYVVLPSNEYDPVMSAVATEGPLAISVEAAHWSDYETGVFDGCNKTHPDLDHGVVLIGYGTDNQLGDYWLVRNSWTTKWGENGYIRLKRSSAVECGVDITPSDGDGCKGGPPQVTVCGTCGILYDVVYPIVPSNRRN